MEWFGRNPVGSIKTAVSPLCGNHDTKRARTGLRPSRFSPRLRQATDLAVAQAVVDEDEKFAGRGHAADLSAPAFAHVAVVASDGRVGALSDHALDGGPAHEAGPLLGDVAPVHLTSDSLWIGVSPAQLQRWRALLNLAMSPISATNTAASTGPTPGMVCTAW